MLPGSFVRLRTATALTELGRAAADVPPRSVITSPSRAQLFRPGQKGHREFPGRPRNRTPSLLLRAQHQELPHTRRADTAEPSIPQTCPYLLNNLRCFEVEGVRPLSRLKNTSGFCAVPCITGHQGVRARPRCACTSWSSIIMRICSSESF